MGILQVLGVAGPRLEIRAIEEKVKQWEDLGLDGVVVSDHLFISGDTESGASGPPEPLTLLAAIGALSARLVLGTTMINVGFHHPALVLRAFAQLATLYGGARVLAGIGAGWNAEEFEAIGWPPVPYQQRMDRLEDACIIARQLFDRGRANHEGKQASARNLPFTPRPAEAPRLMLGGGSERLLELAGRYADDLDLNGSSRRGKVGGLGAVASQRQRARLLRTTTDDLCASTQRVEEIARATGRDPGALRCSITTVEIQFCSRRSIQATEEAICSKFGVEAVLLADCPYVFIGDPEQMRDALAERVERVGLKRIIINPTGDGERFIRQVVQGGSWR